MGDSVRGRGSLGAHLRGAVRTGLMDVSRLVLPVWCAGCARVDIALCTGCAAALQGPVGDVRAVAGGLPPQWRGDVSTLVSVARYEDRVRATLVAWKDHGRLDLGPVISRALARALLGAVLAASRSGDLAPGTGVVVVPVPSSSAASRRRGGDLLAETAGAALALAAPVLAGHGFDARLVPALVQRAGVHDQAGLDAQARAANLAGRLRLRPGVPPSEAVVLVDDVVTTGSSLREATRVLAAGGHRVVAAATVSATPRRADQN